MQTAADWMGRHRGSVEYADHSASTMGVARASAIDRWALRQILRHLNDPRVNLTLWDETSLGPPAAAARVSVRIADRPTLFGLVWDPEVAFGDGYSDRRIDVSGDLIYLLDAAYRAPEGRLHRHPHASNTRGRARDNVYAHYDLGNEFYQLWLDRQMVYTCAYYAEPTMSLEQAQMAKLDLVCRKLDLRPGLRVVEAGSGWGALALHMARHYDVTVKAYNVSREQTAYARQRAVEEGLSSRVEFIEDDYRAITGTFDRFASIGMLEHVGRDQFETFGRLIDRVLDPVHGRGLLHFIGRNQAAPLSRWIAMRIFPGAYPPTLAEVCDGVLAPWRMSVLDVENLRLHYARTLEEWGARHEAALETVSKKYGSRFARAWHLYLAGSQVSFTSGSLQLFQVSFARERDNSIPWTRAALYDAG